MPYHHLPDRSRARDQRRAPDPKASPAPGRSLDPAARAFLEPRLGHSFGDVQIHADAEADALAREFEARAFTVGSDIYFRSGAYDPSSPGGLRLLAHELAHTAQQAAGPVSGTEGPGGVRVSDPSDSFEQAAERAADAALLGLPAGVGASAGGAGDGAAAPTVQRDDEDGFSHDISLLPPELRLSLGPWSLNADTSSAGLGYRAGRFNAGLGYNYGGDITARLGVGGFNGSLGVNPGSGALSLGGSYDQFRFGANADFGAGTGGFSLGYGSPLLPWHSDLSRSVYAGAAGLHGAVGALPSLMDDPIAYYQSQQANIQAISGAYGALSGLAGQANPTQRFGVGVTGSFSPDRWGLMGGLRLNF